MSAGRGLVPDPHDFVNQRIHIHGYFDGRDWRGGSTSDLLLTSEDPFPDCVSLIRRGRPVLQVLFFSQARTCASLHVPVGVICDHMWTRR